MDKRIKMLSEWGCDIASAMTLMLNDEDFYIECLGEIPDDIYFEGLTTALKDGDIAKAFDCAHTLKGVLINLGLTPMFNKDVEIVESLRAKKIDGMIEKNNELLEMKEHLSYILSLK